MFAFCPSAVVKLESAKPKSGGRTISSCLYSPLKTQNTNKGKIYVFTHNQEPFIGMNKIGFTCGEVEDRLKYWAKCCHGFPILLFSEIAVPHPKRVESLTDYELKEYQYKEEWCLVHGHAHVEWFKVDIERAKSVVANRSEWMRSEPYDQAGYLEPFWKYQFDHLMRNRVLITAQRMVDILRLEEFKQEIWNRLNELLSKDKQIVVKVEVKGEK